jgi:hypothetical protein
MVFGTPVVEEVVVETKVEPQTMSTSTINQLEKEIDNKN